MQLGIFAKTFRYDTPEENLDSIREHGFECVQYNLVCAGLSTLPERIEPSLLKRIGQALVERGLSMAAISGTFNVICHDRTVLETNFRRLRTLAEACQILGTRVITLCTGTRDAENMWRRHPDNDTEEAWRDMVASVRKIVRIGEETGVTMAIEPEVNNVVDSAAKARRLLDEIGSSQLKVVMDGANLFHHGELPRMREVLDEAFELLQQDIVIAHAKDLSQDGDAGHEAAGTGVLDYDYYLSLLTRSSFNGPLITHGLSAAQVPTCVSFLRDRLAAVGAMSEGS